MVISVRTFAPLLCGISILIGTHLLASCSAPERRAGTKAAPKVFRSSPALARGDSIDWRPTLGWLEGTWNGRAWDEYSDGSELELRLIIDSRRHRYRCEYRTSTGVRHGTLEVLRADSTSALFREHFDDSTDAPHDFGELIRVMIMPQWKTTDAVHVQYESERRNDAHAFAQLLRAPMVLY